MHRGRFGSTPTAGLLALLAVATGLTACEEQKPLSDDGIEYAALGDSFTAAPYLPKSSAEGCFRSDHNYPHQVAVALSKTEDVQLRDVSCGGARTDAILQSQVQPDRVQTPQIDAVTADTDIVTLGIGVNDLKYSYTAAFQCLLFAQSDPDGAPCKKANGRKVPRLLEQIEDRVVDALGAIGNRAPDARIILVGYPLLMPDSGGCPDRFPIARGDVGFVRESFVGINETLEAAAREADVEYVDVAAASVGHDICSDDPWINGKRKDRETKAAPYHPTPAEQEAVARLVLDLL